MPKHDVSGQKIFKVTPQTLETVLPSIIKDLVLHSAQESDFLTIPGISNKLDIPSYSFSRNVM